MKTLYWAAVTSTVLGLAGGLYYRELTKAHNFSGKTELAVVHTHLLALGTLMFLIVLMLERVFLLSQSRVYPWFLWIYSVGLTWTVAFLAINGTRAVLGRPTTDALAGMAGMGHILLAAGFALFFVTLAARIRHPATTTSHDL